MSTGPLHHRRRRSNARLSRPKDNNHGENSTVNGIKECCSIAKSADFNDEREHATVSPSISSCLPSSGGCVFLETLPTAPAIHDAPIKLIDAHFERCVAPKRLKNQTRHHSKCRAAFILERTRADSAVKEAERQNGFVNEYQSELREYSEASQIFMIKQQEDLKTQSEKIVQLTIINAQLTADATALKAEVVDLKKELDNKQGAKNAELEGKIRELATQLKNSKNEYKVQLKALLHVVQLEMKGS